VRLPDPQARDQVLEEMAARGVQCGIHYPIPVHLQEAYRFLGYGPGSFPVAERWASQCLSLPMFPELTADQIAAVVRELKACVQSVVHRAPNVVVA
nr:DegT/DnrJ/EryC1/StrS family aminotransferase [Verrucomicrobiota bacterium]